MLIAIEGIDGSGKATQSRAVAKAMKAKVISFPQYDSPIGKCIERELKNPKMSPLEFQALMLADKYSAAKVLDEGFTNIILDRYWMSAVAYGSVDGIDRQWLIDVHHLLPRPNYWILIDVPVDASVKRRPERRDHYEKNLDKLNTIRATYLELFSKKAIEDPRRWHIVDGNREAYIVSHDILDIVSPR